MNLKLERVKHNFTQNDLSDKSSVSRTTISKIEKGELDNVTVKTLKKIAEALNSTVQELFFN